jgi:hypothetical protein
MRKVYAGLYQVARKVSGFHYQMFQLWATLSHSLYQKSRKG